MNVTAIPGLFHLTSSALLLYIYLVYRTLCLDVFIVYLVTLSVIMMTPANKRTCSMNRRGQGVVGGAGGTCDTEVKVIL
jgi:hypothetical protein